MGSNFKYKKRERQVAMSDKQSAKSFIMPETGFIPIGGIIAWIGGYFSTAANGTYVPVLASADLVAAANKYLNPLGYYVCDGTPLNDPASPIWNSASTYLPQLSDGRFLHGSTAISAGGSDTVVNHTHTTSSFALVAEASHIHNWPPQQGAGEGGAWSNDDARVVTSDYGDGSGSVYSDGAGSGIGYWGTGASPSGQQYTSTLPALTHSHTMSCTANSFGDCYRRTYDGEGVPGYVMQVYGTATDAVDPQHAHSISSMPAHRHYIYAAATSNEGAHTHTIGGYFGTGAAPSSTNNEPQYLNCFFIVRVK